MFACKLLLKNKPLIETIAVYYILECLSQFEKLTVNGRTYIHWESSAIQKSAVFVSVVAATSGVIKIAYKRLLRIHLFIVILNIKLKTVVNSINN